MTAPDPNTIREAVGYFETPEALQDAVDDLLSSGFDRAELSFLAAEATVEKKLGHRYRKVSELEDSSQAQRSSYVSTESIGDAEGALIGAPLYVAAGTAAGAILATGGTLAAAVGAAALAGGAGALVGGVLAKIVGDQHARHMQEQLERGGLLLWVRTRDEQRERSATDILRRNSGRDVHVHDLPA